MEFFLLLCGTLVAAMIVPSWGSALGSGGYLASFLIMLMYLSMGMGVPFRTLLSGMKEIKLHLYTQSAIFLISPMLALLFFSAISGWTGKDQALGILFVGCLPTTLTSCVMLTQKLKGNHVGAMYNSILSQILGIILSPLLLAVLLSTQVRYGVDLAKVFLDLSIKIIIPLSAGQMTLLAFPGFVRKLGKIPSKVSFYSIFVILFMNIGEAITRGNFYRNLTSLSIPIIAAGMLSSSLVLVLWLGTRLCRFPLADSISASITGSHKTLGMGIPLVIAYFPTQKGIVNNVSLVVIAYYIWSLLLSPLIIRNFAAHLDIGKRQIS